MLKSVAAITTGVLMTAPARLLCEDPSTSLVPVLWIVHGTEFMRSEFFCFTWPFCSTDFLSLRLVEPVWTDDYERSLRT